MNQIPRRKGKRRIARYRRRNTVTTVLITVASTLLVLFIAFLIVGNVLHNKGLNNSPESDDTVDTPPTNDTSEHIRPNNIQAHNVLLETAGTGTFKDRVAALTTEGIRSVSVSLNDKSGVLLYKSNIAPALGFTSNANVSLDKAIESVSDKNVYYSGVYYVNAFSVENEKQRSVELARSAAVISEILDSGVNEVVIIAPDITNEHTDELIRLYSNIKALSANGFIGITLTDRMIAAEDAANTIDQLYNVFDFISFSVIGNGVTTPESISESISAIDSIYLYMYNVRILLPALFDADASNALKDEISKIGINNVQFII